MFDRINCLPDSNRRELHSVISWQTELPPNGLIGGEKHLILGFFCYAHGQYCSEKTSSTAVFTRLDPQSCDDLEVNSSNFMRVDR